MVQLSFGLSKRFESMDQLYSIDSNRLRWFSASNTIVPIGSNLFKKSPKMLTTWTFEILVEITSSLIDLFKYISALPNIFSRKQKFLSYNDERLINWFCWKDLPRRRRFSISFRIKIQKSRYFCKATDRVSQYRVSAECEFFTDWNGKPTFVAWSRFPNYSINKYIYCLPCIRFKTVSKQSYQIKSNQFKYWNIFA